MTRAPAARTEPRAPQRRWARVPRADVRSIGWLVFVTTGVVGAALLVPVAFTLAEQMPVAAVIGALGAAVLVAAWTRVLARLPMTTRPAASGVLASIVWGGLAATGLYALPANGALFGLLAQTLPVDFVAEWGAAVIAPLTEELAKLLGIVAILLAARHRLRHPVEGAVLGALVGLGFEATELVVYAGNADVMTFGENPVQTATTIVMLREVLLLGFSHMLLTAIAGMGLAWLWPASGAPARRWGKGLSALAFAYGAHLLWNSPLLTEILPRLAGAVVLPVLALWLLQVARRDERAWQRAVLAPDVESGLIPGVYLESPTTSWRQQRKRLGAIARAYGYPATLSQIALDARLADLADAITAPDPADAARLREELRAQLSTASTTAT